ncbi:hypothetical protein ACIQKB_04020 [Streptomyces sp. NPDC092046]|uniref:hypothetical protein n=1 Tax=Streptomyces sp. NPDC092046 TaxID=3366009 RepID=UPI00380DFDCF
MTQPAAEQLLNLANRAERGPLTADEAARLRAGLTHHCARADQAESRLAALKRAHVALATQAGKDQAAIERLRKALAERRAEIADYEAETEPAPWSDAAANTCSRIEDALREFPEPQGILAALDPQEPQP